MDASYLLDLASGDRKLVKEILGDFLSSDAVDRQALATAIEARNASDVHQAAHRIKGAARSIGATAYADKAATLEHAAAAGADLSGMLQELEQEAHSLSDWAAAFE